MLIAVEYTWVCDGCTAGAITREGKGRGQIENMAAMSVYPAVTGIPDGWFFSRVHANMGLFLSVAQRTYSRS